MLGLLAVPLSEIKGYVVLLSFYIKMMKGRRLQACSLRHGIKNGMLSVWGKLDLFKSARRAVLPPPPPPPRPPLPLATCLAKKKSGTLFNRV